jgi:hypothetical protein
MDQASGAGRALVAAGHLDKHAIVVVANPIHLSITTVSGATASDIDEDLGAVPGGATVTDWTIHLPTPDPVGDIVRAATTGSSHLSAEVPLSESATKVAGSSSESALNLGALAERTREGR